MKPPATPPTLNAPLKMRPKAVGSLPMLAKLTIGDMPMYRQAIHDTRREVTDAIDGMPLTITL